MLAGTDNDFKSGKPETLTTAQTLNRCVVRRATHRDFTGLNCIHRIGYSKSFSRFLDRRNEESSQAAENGCTKKPVRLADQAGIGLENRQ